MDHRLLLFAVLLHVGRTLAVTPIDLGTTSYPFSITNTLSRQFSLIYSADQRFVVLSCNNSDVTLSASGGTGGSWSQSIDGAIRYVLFTPKILNAVSCSADCTLSITVATTLATASGILEVRTGAMLIPNGISAIALTNSSSSFWGAQFASDASDGDVLTTVRSVGSFEDFELAVYPAASAFTAASSSTIQSATHFVRGLVIPANSPFFGSGFFMFQVQRTNSDPLPEYSIWTETKCANASTRLDVFNDANVSTTLTVNNSVSQKFLIGFPTRSSFFLAYANSTNVVLGLENQCTRNASDFLNGSVASTRTFVILQPDALSQCVNSFCWVVLTVSSSAVQSQAVRLDIQPGSIFRTNTVYNGSVVNGTSVYVGVQLVGSDPSVYFTMTPDQSSSADLDMFIYREANPFLFIFPAPGKNNHFGTTPETFLLKANSGVWSPGLHIVEILAYSAPTSNGLNTFQLSAETNCA